ncbi:hypothetical protein RGQ29_015678 [Quercus rubra]|uniref:Uncharacterized protein n=1 Tax=Quercus rubra TaxID=3512 RepID=A0AAN7FQP2_QUERU|nr:hypothetical protein RGQ29_015678 [Quercus rubra]
MASLQAHPSLNEGVLHFFTGFFAAFSLLFGFLLTLVGLKYQNPSVSIFHTHGAIMLFLIIDVLTCFIALVMIVLQISNQRYLTFFKNVCLVSGAFACDLLLLILVPPFGWFIFAVCVSILVWLLYGSYQVILERFQEILRLVSESASQAFHIFL